MTLQVIRSTISIDILAQKQKLIYERVSANSAWQLKQAARKSTTMHSGLEADRSMGDMQTPYDRLLPNVDSNRAWQNPRIYKEMTMKRIEYTAIILTEVQTNFSVRDGVWRDEKRIVESSIVETINKTDDKQQT